MLRKLIAVFAIAFLTAVTTGGAAFALDDRKSVSGNACVPEETKKAKKFKYSGGAIINNDKKNHHVTCLILRDRYAGNQGAGAEIDRVSVYVERDSGASVNLACSFIVRDLATQAVLASQSALTGAAGPAVLNIPATDYNGAIYNAGYEVRCLLPKKSRIKGIVYEEDSTTDNEPE